MRPGECSLSSANFCPLVLMSIDDSCQNQLLLRSLSNDVSNSITPSVFITGLSTEEPFLLSPRCLCQQVCTDAHFSWWLITDSGRSLMFLVSQTHFPTGMSRGSAPCVLGTYFLTQGVPAQLAFPPASCEMDSSPQTSGSFDGGRSEETRT